MEEIKKVRKMGKVKYVIIPKKSNIEIGDIVAIKKLENIDDYILSKKVVAHEDSQTVAG